MEDSNHYREVGTAEVGRMPDKGTFPAAMIAGQGKCGTNALAEALYKLKYNFPLTQYSIAVEDKRQGFAGEVNWPNSELGCGAFTDEQSLAEYKQLFSPADAFGPGWRWVDKSTTNLRCSKEIAESFPTDVKFFNIVCDPVMAVWSRMNHLRQVYGKDRSNPSELDYVLEKKLYSNTSCEVLARGDERLEKQLEVCFQLQDGLELIDFIRQWKENLGSRIKFLLAEQSKKDHSYLVREAAAHLGVQTPQDQTLEIMEVHTNAREDTYLEPEGVVWEHYIHKVKPVFRSLIQRIEFQHPDSFTGLAATWSSVFGDEPPRSWPGVPEAPNSESEEQESESSQQQAESSQQQATSSQQQATSSQQQATSSQQQATSSQQQAESSQQQSESSQQQAESSQQQSESSQDSDESTTSKEDSKKSSKSSKIPTLDGKPDERTVFAPNSTVDGNKVKGPDGKTIGTLHSDGSVTNPNGDVVGLRREDGAVVRTSVSGLPWKSVVSPQSTLDDSVVRVVGGNPIGHLQDDGKTVVDKDGKVVGVRRNDGAIVKGGLITMDGDDVIGADGKLIGTLQSDGTLTDSEGNVIGMKSVDGAVVTGFAPHTTVDGNHVKRLPDGQPIGTLHSDGSVTNTEGNVIGVRNQDGAVVRISVSGLPMDYVVSSQSTVDGNVVRRVDGQAIGHLLKDGHTVVDSEGSTVGIMKGDGAVIAAIDGDLPYDASPMPPPPSSPPPSPSPPPQKQVLVKMPNCTVCGKHWCDDAEEYCTTFDMDDGYHRVGPHIDEIGCHALESLTPYCAGKFSAADKEVYAIGPKDWFSKAAVAQREAEAKAKKAAEKAAKAAAEAAELKAAAAKAAAKKAAKEAKDKKDAAAKEALANDAIREAEEAKKAAEGPVPAAGLTPGTAPAPQPAAGAASEAAPLPNDYVPTGPQKAHTLPTIYYINLDEEKDMRERLERNLKPYTEKLVRVPAVNKADVVACLEKDTPRWGGERSCAKDPRARVLGQDFMNTDGYLYWELHGKNIFSPGEFGCTFSHLKAIYQAYVDGEQTALIVEDDITFDDATFWPESIQDVMAEAPPDWGILQLWTNNAAFYQYVHRGENSEKVPPYAKKGIDVKSPLCNDGAYNRPAFVPWYDDVWPKSDAERQHVVARERLSRKQEKAGVLPPLYGGLWSTMAYVINRKGMKAIVDKLQVGPKSLGNLTLPILADHLLFKVANTYTYTRPLFRAYPRKSTIQPTMENGIDPTKGRVEAGVDPWMVTDGLTNQFNTQYWTGGTCPLSSPQQVAKRLNLAVLATASFSETERRIQLSNVEKLARGIESTRIVMYAINAIDNNAASWFKYGLPSKAEKLGIATMITNSKRDLDRGFESKLVSQLPLLEHIKKRVAYDYVFMMDGDIALAKADVEGLFRSVRSVHPLIAQPTIRTPTDVPDWGKEFAWGSQWYKPLNDDQAYKCGKSEEYDSPMVESQAAILSSAFLNWYHDELVQVARVQHEYQCDWGHDEMWCSAAARLSEEMLNSRPACVVVRHSVDHHDTKSIEKVQTTNDAGNIHNFLADCQRLEQAFQLDKEDILANGVSPDFKGKVTRVSIAALRDHISVTCVNEWADLHEGGCKAPNEDNTAIKSYRAMVQGLKCHDLLQEKEAAEEVFAVTKLSRPDTPVMGEDMMSKGRRLYGPHFTPTGRSPLEVQAALQEQLVVRNQRSREGAAPSPIGRLSASP